MNQQQNTNELAAGIALIQRNPKLVVSITLLTLGLGVVSAAVATPTYESMAVVKLGRASTWINSQVRPQSIMEAGELIDDLRAKNGLDNRDPSARSLPRLESVQQTDNGEHHAVLVATAKTPAEAKAFLKNLLAGLLKEHHALTDSLTQGIAKAKTQLETRRAELSIIETRHLLFAEDIKLEPALRSQHAILAGQAAVTRRLSEDRLKKVSQLAGPLYNQPTAVLMPATEGQVVRQSSLPVRGVLSLVLGFFFGLLLAFLRDLSRGLL